MKRRDLKIIQRDGRLLVMMAQAPLPVSLSQLAREHGYQLPNLCEHLSISERHLRRIFEEGIGMAPKDWLRHERMVDARKLLRSGSPIKQISAELGFSNPKVFAREFRTFYGVKPTEFQDTEFERAARAVAVA